MHMDKEKWVGRPLKKKKKKGDHFLVVFSVHGFSLIYVYRDMLKIVFRPIFSPIKTLYE